MDITVQTAAEIRAALAQCICTEGYHRHWSGLLFTDGVQEMAQMCKAFWLIDLVASYQAALRKSEGLREFQLWELTKHSAGAATVTCAADSGRSPAVKQEIEYTTFPLDSIKLYVEEGVLLLPFEH